MTSKIPFHRPYSFKYGDVLDLKEEFGYILDSGIYSKGHYVKTLENQVRERYDVKYAIATSSATMGLKLCFDYLNGSYCTDTLGCHKTKLHMPNFTWNSVFLAADNYDVVFHDIDPETWLVNYDWDKIEHHDVISPCHTFGNIIELEKEYRVVYDGAHALGCELDKIGDATVFSLAPTKLVTSGEGGIVITNQPYLASFVRYRRDMMARMSEFNALIGLYTLNHLDEILESKKNCFNYYRKHIRGRFQKIPNNSNHNTIGFLNVNNLAMPEDIEIKQYYKPCLQYDLLPRAYETFHNMVCLPSWHYLRYQNVVMKIKEANE